MVMMVIVKMKDGEVVDGGDDDGDGVHDSDVGW